MAILINLAIVRVLPNWKFAFIKKMAILETLDIFDILQYLFILIPFLELNDGARRRRSWSLHLDAFEPRLHKKLRNERAAASKLEKERGERRNRIQK